MTHTILALAVRTIFEKGDETLTAPVLEHHVHLVTRHRGTFHGKGLLVGLFDGEGIIQPLKDRIVLARTHALGGARIVT